MIWHIFSLNIVIAKKIPLISPFIEKFNNLKYENKKIKDYKITIAGQVLIDKSFRGKGILEKLWKSFAKNLSKNYDLIVTGISSSNPRSYYACTKKLNMKLIGKGFEKGKQWYLLAYDLKN